MWCRGSARARFSPSSSFAILHWAFAAGTLPAAFHLPNDPSLVLMIVMTAIGPFSSLLAPLTNFLSRRAEFQADAFAKSMVGCRADDLGADQTHARQSRDADAGLALHALQLFASAGAGADRASAGVGFYSDAFSSCGLYPHCSKPASPASPRCGLSLGAPARAGRAECRSHPSRQDPRSLSFIVIEQDFEHVADVADLAPIATDIIQDGAFGSADLASGPNRC